MNTNCDRSGVFFFLSAGSTTFQEVFQTLNHWEVWTSQTSFHQLQHLLLWIHSEPSDDSSLTAFSPICVSVLESKNKVTLYFEALSHSFSDDWSVPVPVFFRRPLVTLPSHLSSTILRILVTCGCLAALIKGSSSELLPDDPEKYEWNINAPLIKTNTVVLWLGLSLYLTRASFLSFWELCFSSSELKSSFWFPCGSFLRDLPTVHLQSFHQNVLQPQ